MGQKVINMILCMLISFSCFVQCGTSMKQRPKGLAKFVCYTEVSLYQGSFVYNKLFYYYWGKKIVSY